jgi:hypothetical protein
MNELNLRRSSQIAQIAGKHMNELNFSTILFIAKKKH